MKELADKHHRELHFTEGDMVLVKLHPRRQSTVVGAPYTKLAKRYYGPFQVIQKLSPVAYKLNLPPTSRIHPVFHCSLLRPYNPPLSALDTPIMLPESAEDNQPLVTPLTILDSKWSGSGDDHQLLLLVQWSGLWSEDTSWEPWHLLKETYNLGGKVVFDAHGNVITRDMKQQEAETEPISELKPATMQEKEPKATTETRRPKREITKPQYLKDFVAK